MVVCGNCGSSKLRLTTNSIRLYVDACYIGDREMTFTECSVCGEMYALISVLSSDTSFYISTNPNQKVTVNGKTQ